MSGLLSAIKKSSFSLPQHLTNGVVGALAAGAAIKSAELLAHLGIDLRTGYAGCTGAALYALEQFENKAVTQFGREFYESHVYLQILVIKVSLCLIPLARSIEKSRPRSELEAYLGMAAGEAVLLSSRVIGLGPSAALSILVCGRFMDILKRL